MLMMRNYSFLEITTLYYKYVEYFEKKYNTDNLSYEEHKKLLSFDGFAEADFIHNYNRELGNESNIIYYDYESLQRKWHDFKCQKKTLFDILLDQVKYYRPDVIYISCISNFSASEIEMIKNYEKGKNVRLVGYHFTFISAQSCGLFKKFDQIYTGSNNYVKKLNDKGANAFLVRHAFEPDIINRVSKNKKESRVCFSGSIIFDMKSKSHLNRLDMLQAMHDVQIKYDSYGYIYIEKSIKGKIKQIIGGGLTYFHYKNIVEKIEDTMRPPVFGIDYYECLASHCVGVNTHSPIIESGAGNMRMFEVTGVGTCLITDKREENSLLFEEGKEIVVYDGVEDLISKINWLIDNPREIERIAVEGQKRTINDYNYKNKMLIINDYIQKIL